jgi:hypothetical protein
VDTIAPSIPEGSYLLGLAGDVVGIAVLHVTGTGGPLEVAVELDALGRIEIDALHFPAQALALGKTRHHLKGIAEYHAVRPVLVVLIELGFVSTLRDAATTLLVRGGPAHIYRKLRQERAQALAGRCRRP